MDIFSSSFIPGPVFFAYFTSCQTQLNFNQSQSADGWMTVSYYPRVFPTSGARWLLHPHPNLTCACSARATPVPHASTETAASRACALQATAGNSATSSSTRARPAANPAATAACVWWRGLTTGAVVRPCLPVRTAAFSRTPVTSTRVRTERSACRRRSASPVSARLASRGWTAA